MKWQNLLDQLLSKLYNFEVFTNDMFLPASATDILSSEVDNNQQIVNSNTLSAAHSSSNLIDEEMQLCRIQKQKKVFDTELTK